MSIFNKENTRFNYSFKVALSLIIIIWLVHLIHIISGEPFYLYGILPQKIEGIKGIFLSPFIHSQKKWMHIINNTPPLFFGTLLIFYFYRTIAFPILIYTYLFSGILTWFFAGFFQHGQYQYHIGASGVVYGLISFIFFSGIFRRNMRSVILAMIMLLMYSGMVVGLFPDANHEISWQGHLMGAIVGVILAYQYRNVLEKDELQYFEKIPDKEALDEQFYLPNDTFEATKEERRKQNNFWQQNNTWD